MTIAPILWCATFVLGGFKAFAVEIPYEKCDWKNQAYTQKLVDDHLNNPSQADCPNIACATNLGDLRGSRDHTTTIEPAKQALQIPLECFFASAVRSQEKKPEREKDSDGTESANYYYCSSPDISSSENSAMQAVDGSGEGSAIDPRPPCLNKDYITMTANTFHKMAECFDLGPTEQKNLFALLNHESSFILNQKSDTGARCYGQLTTITIQEINKRIYVRDRSDSFKSEIYHDFASKCPNLLSEIKIPNRILEAKEVKDKSWQGHVWKAERYRGKEYDGAMDAYTDNFRGILDAGSDMNCQLTQDPNTCFFYAMYNMKKNQMQLERTLTNTSADFPESADLNADTPKSKKLKKIHTDFKLPLGQNEMLIIKGPITINGVTEEKTWLMKNGREVYNLFFNSKSTKSYNIENLEVRKVDVFSFDEQAKADILYQAYNGGISVVSTALETYVNKQKDQLSKGSVCEKCKNSDRYKKDNPDQWCDKWTRNYCPKREQLMGVAKKTLPFSPREFGSTMTKVKDDGMTYQASKMPFGVQRDQDYLRDTKYQQNRDKSFKRDSNGNRIIDKSNPNPLTTHLYKLRGVKPDDSTKRDTTKQAEKQAIDNFVQSLKDKCSDL